MADPLFAITDKLDRADDHFQIVKDMVRAYFDSDISRYRGQYDPNTQTHHVEGNIRFPHARLATIVGELVHDLRSALDHLAWRLVKENGGTPVEGPRGTSWPILKDPPPQRLQVAGGVSATALALIERSQPWWPEFVPPINSAYDALWVLQRMSIIDKHQQIPIQGTTADHFHFGSGDTVPAFTWTAELVSADERRAEFRIVPDDATVNVYGTFEVFVIVHEPPGHPNVLTDTLGGALRSIRGIVDEARATCIAP